ncbi:hypothetical protein AAGU66_06145 [Edwardsiella ictaluri]|uniref:Uncharacterized protein n=2 Tax=Edwardsiella ictaluri TaxID=67780 RepID=C5BDS9_EDWI9|nr:hypothetical protein [Edwardsiella ictaluri]ACR68627.1 hypothetical protein NT01EI_1441 [Edwardsiella ictaluri 93-146]QPW29738.1 hypothetical protein F8539_06780 [Edwardsiella ictaluri]UYB62860.1 hypothetical protein N8I66_06760 [Edwardsiella ictaluri]UYB66086.1 hypothetical protein N8I67_06755 [Edwardsiella ictaluri]WFO10173.1 hypothetical protein MAY76_01295 [Edwardsiella ictaluri]
MNTKQLTPQEKTLADELALERVYAMNNDEYLLQRVDEKIHRLEGPCTRFCVNAFSQK